MASSDYIPALIPEDARPTPVKKLSGRELLQQTSINSILPTHDAFSVRGEESILVALQTLTVKHILALPVFDSRTRQYTSFIDMFDISNFVTDKYAEVTPSELAAHTCSELADISTRNPYRAVEERASLDAALQLIIGGKLHRLAVLDAEGRFNNILSQSALVRFISDHISAFPFAERRVGELQLGYREVITVRDTVTAHEAFAVIKASKVSAVPVLNADGVMVEVLSISDQRILLQQSTPDNPLPLSLLNLNVVEYLSHRVYASEALRVARGLVVVTPAATVEEVLFKIVATRVHRAYVVHELKPVGVIALYDILKLASEAK